MYRWDNRQIPSNIRLYGNLNTAKVINTLTSGSILFGEKGYRIKYDAGVFSIKSSYNASFYIGLSDTVFHNAQLTYQLNTLRGDTVTMTIDKAGVINVFHISQHNLIKVRKYYNLSDHKGELLFPYIKQYQNELFSLIIINYTHANDIKYIEQQASDDGDNDDDDKQNIDIENLQEDVEEIQKQIEEVHEKDVDELTKKYNELYQNLLSITEKYNELSKQFEDSSNGELLEKYNELSKQIGDSSNSELSEKYASLDAKVDGVYLILGKTVDQSDLDALNTNLTSQLAGKVGQSDLDALNTNLTSQLAGKVGQSDLDALNTNLSEDIKNMESKYNALLAQSSSSGGNAFIKLDDTKINYTKQLTPTPSSVLTDTTLSQTGAIVTDKNGISLIPGRYSITASILVKASNVVDEYVFCIMKDSKRVSSVSGNRIHPTEYATFNAYAIVEITEGENVDIRMASNASSEISIIDFGILINKIY